MHWRRLAAATALSFGIALVYGSALEHDFVEFDDPLYVTSNAQVAKGLSLETAAWAFQNADAFVWHPLTWLSYLADASLYGVERAGPWLRTNIGLHTLATLLLLWLLTGLTGRIGPAMVVAGAFALHPLQVEAVAWVSGRKEVLAGVFCMLTLVTYAAYARTPSATRYAGVFLAFAACLLAKGTLVTLPFVLLAADVWPLRRLEGMRPSLPSACESLNACEPRSISWLALEKLPLLLLAVATLAVQLSFVGRAENVWGNDPPLVERVPIVISALGGALTRFFSPTGLSLLYPSPQQLGLDAWPVGNIIGIALGLAAIVIVALLRMRREPAILLGTLWFFVLLGPMSGIVPAGLRSMHDRYSYIPLIGLCIALVYGFDAISQDRPRLRRAGAIFAFVALAACALVSHQQVQVWRNSESLFANALAVEERNAVIRYSRGIARAKAGQRRAAIEDLEGAIEIHPAHADAHTALGYLLGQAGDAKKALPHLERAVALRPSWPLGLTNLARALETQGNASRALSLFEQAVALNPNSADAHYWLGIALARRGQSDASRASLEAALHIAPEHRFAKQALAGIKARTKR